MMWLCSIVDLAEHLNMGQKRWLFLLAVFACLLSFSCGRVLKFKSDDGRPVYNHTLAITLVEYTSAVYMSDLSELFTWTCERCNGLTKGFEVIEVIVDVEHCLQAYVGVAKDLNAIIIAFRGTQEHSIQNWVSDLFWKQLDLNYPDMPDAMVHHGFYSAYHNTTVRPAVLDAVKRAKKSYGANLEIMVTGHSMGGAMASFCALDLVVNEGEENVQVMTFGQPRVGNAAFSSYYSLLVPNTFRIIHDHDIVPHLPPYYHLFPQKTYHHFPTEVWVTELNILNIVIYGVEKVCDDTGEDPTCSRSVMGSSISDHLTYFGVELMGETWRQCNIVMMSHEMESYSRKDSKGNIFLSRTVPSTEIIETKSLSKTRISSQ
ncbi:lipase isoform X1 [Capsella rubella]|uniref:lipase isoform X1 n=1 Tax=Capsella rubella TaxID=81985 RepID=UPI000CD55EF6|nr:lipase isoform X1 [Capsella rubella]